MGQWSGGSLGSPFGRGGAPPAQGATYTPSYAPSPPSPSGPPAAPQAYAPPAFGATYGPQAGGPGRRKILQLVALAAIVVLALAVAGLAIAYAGTSSKLRSTRSALRESRAQLGSVRAALATDTKGLQAEQQVGVYMRGVRDALTPALSAYNDSGNAPSASAEQADDESAIAALTAAKQKIAALSLPDTLKLADTDITGAMDGLAAGLHAEVTALDNPNINQGLTQFDAALTAEAQALDHLQRSLGEMYTAVGVSGPATGTS